MSPISDPERSEARHLMAEGQFTGRKILEIGCGSAGLTWQYAGTACQVMGIDPSFPALQKASVSRPATLTNVSFAGARGEALPFPSSQFDAVLLSSSL